MRKNVTAILSVLTLSLFLGACQEKQDANHDKVQQKQSIGVVDTARIYADSKAGIAGGEYLEKVQMDMQEELVALQAGLQENPSEASIALFQEKYAGFQERITLEQEQVVNTLNTALQKAMDSYRTEQGLEVLVAAEAVMSMSDTADVTGGIIDILDGMTVEFTPIVMPEPVITEKIEEAAVAPETVLEAAPEVTPEATQSAPEQAVEQTPESAPEAPEVPEAAETTAQDAAPSTAN